MIEMLRVGTLPSVTGCPPGVEHGLLGAFPVPLVAEGLVDMVTAVVLPRELIVVLLMMKRMMI